MRTTQPKKPGEEVEVLRGNPRTTEDLAMSLKFKNTYSSAVIRWHPDDKPTKAQINEVIDAFEEFAFSGLEPDQYDMLVVQHTENNDPHLHIIVPRVELSSGKSMNIAPPKYNKGGTQFHEFDHVRDYFNEKYGWVSPDIEANPENARTTQLGLNRGSRKKLLMSIDEYVTDLINSGDIRDRETLVNELERGGLIVTNHENKYITVIDPTDKKMTKGMRLKGAMYAKDFQIDKWLARTSERKAEQTQANPQPSVAELATRLRKASEKRAEYNEGRYHQAQPKADEINGAQRLKPSLDDSSLSNELPHDLRTGLPDNARKNDHPNRLPNDQLQQRATSPNLQSNELAGGSKQHSYISPTKRPIKRVGRTGRATRAAIAEDAAALQRVIEKLIGLIASLFGQRISITGAKNDGNRNEINPIVNETKRANDLASQAATATNRGFEPASRSPRQIEQELDDIIEIADSAYQSGKLECQQHLE